MNFCLTQVILASSILFSIPSFAQEVGTSVKITNDVRASGSGPARKLNLSDPVFSSETISATQNSHGEIRLKDRSRIIVGPGSKISLDDFLVNNGSLKSGTLHVAKGAFRFISSRGKKAKIVVTTPLTTIGIRGTIFDVYVKAGGVTDVILFSGKIEVCTRAGNCKIVNASCDIVRVKRGNNIKFREFLRSDDRKTEDQEYELISRQSRFPPSWRAPTAICYQRARSEDPSGNGDNDGSNFPAPEPEECGECE